IDGLARCGQQLSDFEIALRNLENARQRQLHGHAPSTPVSIQAWREGHDDEHSARVAKAVGRAHLRENIRAYTSALKDLHVAPERMLVSVKDIVRDAVEHARPMLESRQIVSDAVQWALDVYYPVI
ncbi:MAG: hypothetical protein M3081_13835, partial [Gemmatimonadota bacterium]|nr:hypothetical protein [Gemmatimonadota bacterium]